MKLRSLAVNPRLDRNETWKRDAACAGMGPELFFPAPAGRPQARVNAVAISICRDCPVRGECATYGADEEFGIWGGMAKTERSRVRASGQRRRSA